MTRFRDPILGLGLLLSLLVAGIGAVQSVSWIGRPFPGFLVLANRVVASAGLSRWPATARGEIYQAEVVAVNGRPLVEAADLAAQVEAAPPGTPFRYRLRRGEVESEREIPSRRFDALDFALLFGSYLICGLAVCATALGIRFLRGSDRLAAGTAGGLWIIGMFALTATDLYGPYRLFRLHALFECLLFAGTAHVALVFPHPSSLIRRLPWAPVVIYGAAGLFAIATQLVLFDPPGYVLTHRIAMSAFGVSAAFLILSQLYAYFRPPSFHARQRVKVLALGTFAALAAPVAIVFVSASSGGQAPENLMGWSGFLLPLAIAYAVLRHDLLEVDALLRRSVNYALLTTLVALLYAGALAGFDRLFREATAPSSATLVVSLGVASVLLLLPLRDRLQSTVDRLFFRSSYDFRRLVEKTSARLASVADLEVIAREIQGVVAEALHPASCVLVVRRRPDAALSPVDAGAEATADQAEAIAAAEVQRLPFELDAGGLAVPFRSEGRLVALLVLGRRLSGRYYGGDDRRMLLTLANQGAVAIENALALEQLHELNRNLEQKVDERTSELAAALRELRDTQAQLVSQEKMASLGQLVAGIAHEINNPVHFLQGNLHFLRQYVHALVGAIGACEAELRGAGARSEARLEPIRKQYDLDTVLAELTSTFESCDEGIQRTTEIIKGLRTFSRVDQAECSSIDVHEALESTLLLLRSRLRDVTLVRDYGTLPSVECIAGQISQVLMNLLSNALDAVTEDGTITIRTRDLDGTRIAIEIEDDGDGIEPEALERVFEPFFTTKTVGRGTGLGLAISYGIATHHRGSIQVRSEPGSGSCFRFELPTRFDPLPQGQEPGLNPVPAEVDAKGSA